MSKRIPISYIIPIFLSVIASVSVYAFDPIKQYDQYVYYGDDFKLNIHPGNYLLVKYKDDKPFYLNDGKPFETNLFEIPFVDDPIPTGEYKFLEIKFNENDEILDFYETTVILSPNRTCFSPAINPICK